MAKIMWCAGVVFAQFLTLSTSATLADHAPNGALSSASELGEGTVPVKYTNSGDVQLSIYLTGYSFWDNTPPGSAQIAKPVIHRSAGGIGTYKDPITVAVGHTKIGGRRQMDFPAGTRFYFPRLEKYGIVEDLCGDGPRPQDGPCHSGYNGLAWLDIYVGGRSTGAAAANSCMYAITGVQKVIINPSAGYRVSPGEIATSHCGYSG